MIAAISGESWVVQRFLDLGVDIYQKDNDGHTALDWTTKNGHGNIMRLIKSHMTKQVERQGYVFDLNI